MDVKNSAKSKYNDAVREDQASHARRPKAFTMFSVENVKLENRDNFDIYRNTALRLDIVISTASMLW